MRRRVVAVVLVSLLASGCGGGGRERKPGEVGSELPTTTAGRTSVNQPGTRAPAATDRAGRPVRTTAAPRTPTGSASTIARAVADPIVGAAGRNPGAFAGILLQPQPATKLALDVLREDGVTPQTGTVSRIASELEEASKKAVRVTETAVSLPGEVHSAQEIRDTADKFAATAQGAGTAVVRVLFLAGRYAEGASVLGVAVRGDTFAVFVDQIRRASSPLASASRVERAVVTHELGHLLGLVDIYLDRQRDDPEHPGHSSNSGSVMFWAIESDVVTTVLGGPPPIDFDDDDRADVAAIRNGARPS